MTQDQFARRCRRRGAKVAEVTHDDLRRILFLLETLKRSMLFEPPDSPLWRHASDVYCDDEHLLAVRTPDGSIDPEWLAAELGRAYATLGALAGPRPEVEDPRPEEAP